MKRKIKPGLASFSKVEKDIETVKPNIQSLYYTFKGYGCMIKHKFEAAYECYNKAEAKLELDNSAIFNKAICKGVIKLKEKDFTCALEIFHDALKLFPKKKTASVYQFITYIFSYLSSKLRYNNNYRDYKDLEKAEQHLKAAYLKAEKDSDILFYKGIMLLYKGEYVDGYHDFSSVHKITLRQ